MKSPLFKQKNNYPKHVLKTIMNDDQYKNHIKVVQANNQNKNIATLKEVDIKLNPKTESCELS